MPHIYKLTFILLCLSKQASGAYLKFIYNYYEEVRNLYSCAEVLRVISSGWSDGRYMLHELGN
jgi:hypothetical protein